MRTGLYILILVLLLTGCEKNVGTINHVIKFTTSSPTLKSQGALTEDRYTGLGTYVTSITPRYFGAKMNVMMYQDHWNQGEITTHMISYIDGHDNDPNYEISLYVNFSNNQETTYVPILYGDKWKGLFRQKEVTFNYFYFVPYYFEQEFEIPAEYGNTFGNNGITVDPLTGKRWWKGTQHWLLEAAFGYPDKQPYGYFFGNTSSTFIVNKECANLPASEDYPCGGSHCLVRSNHFTPVTVAMPGDGETIEMYSTVSFNTENLIQIYAGDDNIPYTNDDRFTYAPNFWERIAVNLEVR